MENGGEGIMDCGTLVKVIYIDGKKADGTEHISYKTGEFIKISNNFFCLRVNSQEILIPSSRIIRVEKLKGGNGDGNKNTEVGSDDTKAKLG